MTELEWINSTAIDRLYTWINHNQRAAGEPCPIKPFSERKSRLFAVAGVNRCRDMLGLEHDHPGRDVLDVAETFADDSYYQRNTRSKLSLAAGLLRDWLTTPTIKACWFCSQSSLEHMDDLLGYLAPLDTDEILSGILRDMAGNPFRPQAALLCSNCHGSGQFFVGLGNGWMPCGQCDGGKTRAGHWMTREIHQFALAIYEEKAFERMPELGDLLMRRGCGDVAEKIIAHCGLCKGRKQYHCRGCWALDLLLGRN